MTSSFKSVLRSLDSNLARVLIPWIIHHPKYIKNSHRFVKSFNNAKKLRNKEKEKGLQVPPSLIFSITNNCNLHCSGCYAASVGTLNNNKSLKNKKILSEDKWIKITQEAVELGVFGFIIAGGEPFLYPGLINIIKKFKKNLFLIFSNGTAITETHYKHLKKLSNVGVVISIEGGKTLTNNRRGDGVYQKAISTIHSLNKQGTLSGISVTINNLNYMYWMDPKNIENLISDGVRLGFFMEYIPSSSSDNCSMKKSFKWIDIENNKLDDTNLMLSEEERKSFRKQILKYRSEKKILLIHSPGDEEMLGGCISAGRGFAHITPYGDLTPCPVSDIATHNLVVSSLEEGLKSQLFSLIRENEDLLETGDTPCALYAHPEEVEALAKSIGAYRV